MGATLDEITDGVLAKLAAMIKQTTAPQSVVPADTSTSARVTPPRDSTGAVNFSNSKGGAT